MKILIDNSSYDLLNSGDIAMVKVCLNRLSERYPNAELLMITEAVDTLSKLCSNSTAIDIFIKRKLWSQPRNIFGGFYKLLPNSLEKKAESLETILRMSMPKLMTKWISYRLKKRLLDDSPVKAYYEHIIKADVAIASGGGFMTDAFEEHAINILELLFLVKKQGKPVAMFGQGVGPVSSPRLLATMKKVLPLLDMICLREENSGMQLLLDIGVSKDKIIVTGDDAIELSQSARKDALGNKLGFNVRIADYANIDKEQDISVAKIINNFSNSHETTTVPVPISWYPHENDLEKISDLLNSNIDNQQLSHHNIEALMQRIGDCRVVVTGSYHAGVFALSQGIPVIGLARSAYYVDKFEGLSGMFKSGVQVIRLDQKDWGNELIKALTYSWNNAYSLRDNLRDSANKQVQASRKAYEEFFKLIDQNK